jgi:hypothetical protein
VLACRTARGTNLFALLTVALYAGMRQVLGWVFVLNSLAVLLTQSCALSWQGCGPASVAVLLMLLHWLRSSLEGMK